MVTQMCVCVGDWLLRGHKSEIIDIFRLLNQLITKRFLLMAISSSTSLQILNRNYLENIRGGLTIWKLGHCPRARGQ
ncbi:unnamed protein product [Staurois parvus]|uniref:Uncharacterized protein n=1 Tax=Staurois parvus TaxID=386267 RepID=A0ABN9DJC1_9NEOB|nr:unnamed protein product [Staurois parvus]